DFSSRAACFKTGLQTRHDVCHLGLGRGENVSRRDKGRHMRDRLPAPVDPGRRAGPERGPRPSPTFLAQLIATAQRAPQTRARGRVAPAVATTARCKAADSRRARYAGLVAFERDIAL